MSIFEILMLICFGFSWPFAIIKTYTAKTSAGKSFLFLGLLIFGYICGCLNKIYGKYDNVFYLYVANGVMVSIDLALSIYYRKKNAVKDNA